MQSLIPSSDDREQVEFYVSCRNLKNMDIMSKSDPQVRLYFKNTSNNTWSFFGETEIAKNDLNPNFQVTFQVAFIFETNQHIKFEVVDSDGSGSSELIGSVETTVGAVMGARKQTWTEDLKLKDKKTGQIIVKGEKVDFQCLSVSWQWSGVKLMNTDGWFGKSDPFLRFFKKKADGDYLLVHETEVIKNNLNPVWKPFKIPEKKLYADSSADFKVECWDREGSGKHQFIGEFETSIEKIKSGMTEYELHNPKKKSKTGTLKVSNLSIGPPDVTFVDYLRAGTQLNIVVAIDFTGSNGSPNNSDSLHHKSKDPPNQYAQAISSICPIVLNYDFDGLVPLYGFGGVAPWTGGTSHCFPLANSGASEEVKGVEGILEAYYSCLETVSLSAPTNFETVIQSVNHKCAVIKEAEQDQYVVLLILTDGEISDMPETIEEIVNASELPLSIIIVGVGKADFKNMEKLDGDNGVLKSKGRQSTRDLVQFVPFRDYKGDPGLLASKVLAEVPNQLLQYMKMINKKPLAL